MNITHADYSNLKQSTAVQSYIKQNQTNSIINGISSIANAAGSIANTYKKYKYEQDTAQKTNLKPSLNQKVTNLESMIKASVNDGTSTLGEDGKVIFSEEVQTYIDTWKEDINTDENLSEKVKTWANNYLDGYSSASNDYAFGLINTRNQATIEQNNATALTEAVNVSASQGSSEYLLATIKAMSNGNSSLEAYYTATYMPQYQTEQWKMDVDRIAAEEGYAAAMDYINGLESASADTKTTLLKRADTATNQHEQYVETQAQRSASQMLEDGYSWAEIGTTLTEGLSEYDKSLVKPILLQMQTSEVTPQLNTAMAKITAGTATTAEIQEASKWLDDNRYQFEGGCEALWEAAKAKVDSNYKTATTMTIDQYKDWANNLYNLYNAGEISGDYLYSTLTGMANMCEDIDAVEEMSSILAKVAEQKIPKTYKSSFDMGMDFFKNWQLKELGVSKVTDLEGDAVQTYINNYEWMASTVTDWINSQTEWSDASINDLFAQVQNTFVAKYLDSDTTLKWGLDTAGTQSQSFLDTLAEFENSMPLYVENGSIRWVNDTAKANFENAGLYGLQALNNAGYEFSSFHPLQVGDVAYPMMVFTSKEGNQYAINEDGDICQFVVVDGKIYKGSPVTPKDAAKNEAESIARAVPHNYTFEYTEDIINSKADISTNFKEQQKTLQTEKKQEDRQIESVETEQNRDELGLTEFANRNSGDLTSSQKAYAEEIEATLDVDTTTASKLGQIVDHLRTADKNLSFDDAVSQAQTILDENNGEVPSDYSNYVGNKPAEDTKAALTEDGRRDFEAYSKENPSIDEDIYITFYQYDKNKDYKAEGMEVPYQASMHPNINWDNLLAKDRKYVLHFAKETLKRDELVEAFMKDYDDYKARQKTIQWR